MRICLSLAAVSLLVAAATPALADVAVLSVNPANGGSGFDDRSHGYSFIPSSSLTVDALGLYDWTYVNSSGASSQAAPKQVAIYVNNGVGSPSAPLAVATIDGSEAIDASDFRWESVAPVTLTAGIDYVIMASANWSGADQQWDWKDTGSTFSPDITVDAGGYTGQQSGPSVNVLYPDTVQSYLPYGESFDYAKGGATTPEPASIGLLGLGIGGLLARRHRV